MFHESSIMSSGSYWIEILKATNWMPWKQWMLVVLCDLGLETYIAKDAVAPGFSNPQNWMKDEEATLKKWCQGMDSDWTQHGRLRDCPPEWSRDSTGDVGSVVYGKGIKGSDQDLGNMLSTLPNRGRWKQLWYGWTCLKAVTTTGRVTPDGQ